MLKSSFPAKVLLLGEYTILSGSKALAFPFQKLTGRWSFEQKETSDWEISRKSIQSFLAHSSEKYIDLPKLKRDVEQGLWFDSNIPHGYGVGSSGALIAAIYSAYGFTKSDLLTDKVSLGKLEDFFHGSSSGLDPLVSFLQRPLLIHSFNEVQVLGGDLNLKGFFLLDSGKPRQTGPLVSIFQDKLKDPQFKQGCSDVLSRDVNLAIESVLKNDVMTVKHHLWHISKFQWDYFPEMIPTNIRGPWSRGLETGDYVLKLCGAGGGGFVLGYAKDTSLVLENFRDFEVTFL
jgi:mevalonate kinase